MDCSPPGSSAHGVLQARTLEWVAVPSSRASSRPRDEPVSLVSPALQVSSLPLALPGKPQGRCKRGQFRPPNPAQDWVRHPMPPGFLATLNPLVQASPSPPCQLPVCRAFSEVSSSLPSPPGPSTQNERVNQGEKHLLRSPCAYPDSGAGRANLGRQKAPGWRVEREGLVFI